MCEVHSFSHNRIVRMCVVVDSCSHDTISVAISQGWQASRANGHHQRFPLLVARCPLAYLTGVALSPHPFASTFENSVGAISNNHTVNQGVLNRIDGKIRYD